MTLPSRRIRYVGKWGQMDITKFCAVEDARYLISKPWIKDGWRYATDGRIAVREPTDEPDSMWRIYDEAVALFAGRCDVPGDAPAVPTHDGKGKDWEEPACCVSEYPPKSCKQWGDCPASPGGGGECTNTMTGRTLGPMRFGGQKWQGNYIDLINKELPGARYTVNAKGYMVFRAGDVEGLLAPMKK